MKSYSLHNEPKSDLLFVLGCVLLGALVRLHLLFASNFVIDSDEAIVGLMGKHILEGKTVPIFYYGQHYMGSLEAVIVSIFFALFGVNSVSLKVVPFLFSLALLPVAYSLFSHLMGRFGARCALLLLSIPPLALTEWSSRARGGFIEVIVLATWALLCCVRYLKHGRVGELYLCSFVLGLAWWVNNQIIFYMGPIGCVCALYLLSARDGSRPIRISVKAKTVMVSLLLFIGGGLPYWIYNIENSFVSFRMFTSSGSTEVWKHLGGLFKFALPILFGAKRFWHVEEVFPFSASLVYLLYGAIIISVIWTLRTQIAYMVIGRVSGAAPVLLPFIFIFGCIVFVASSFGFLSQAPRYLLPLYIPLFGMVGCYADSLYPKRATFAIVTVATLILVNLASIYAGGVSIPGEPLVYNGERVSKDHSELISWLKEKGIKKVRTNYWIGYRLAFESQESITFSMYGEPRQIRINSYEVPVLEDLKNPLVLVPSQAFLAKKGMDFLGFQYKEISLSGYVVLYDIEGDLSFFRFDYQCRPPFVSVMNRSEEINNMFDGSLHTRWGSGRHQSPEMEVVVKFDFPIELSAVELLTGDYGSDSPRKLEVDVIDEKGQRSLLYGHEVLGAVHRFLDHGIEFIPVGNRKVLGLVFRQTGYDPVFDWSIAELNLFSPQIISNVCGPSMLTN